MFAANPGLAIKTITASKGADYRPFAIEGAFGDIELKRLDDGYQQHLYEQTEEGQLEKRQEKAVSEYLNNIIQNDKEFKNKCIDIRNKIQDELDKKYGKNKKFALGIGTDDMRKGNLITPEMEARIQEIIFFFYQLL